MARSKKVTKEALKSIIADGLQDSPIEHGGALEAGQAEGTGGGIEPVVNVSSIRVKG